MVKEGKIEHSEFEVFYCEYCGEDFGIKGLAEDCELNHEQAEDSHYLARQKAKLTEAANSKEQTKLG